MLYRQPQYSHVECRVNLISYKQTFNIKFDQNVANGFEESAFETFIYDISTILLVPPGQARPVWRC